MLNNILTVQWQSYKRLEFKATLYIYVPTHISNTF